MPSSHRPLQQRRHATKTPTTRRQEEGGVIRSLLHSVNVTWLRTHARIPTHPVKVGEVGVLGLQALRPHEAREHLDRHGGDHVVAPVGVRRGVVAPRRKDGRDLLQTQQRKKKDSKVTVSPDASRKHLHTRRRRSALGIFTRTHVFGNNIASSRKVVVYTKERLWYKPYTTEDTPQMFGCRQEDGCCWGYANRNGKIIGATEDKTPTQDRLCK